MNTSIIRKAIAGVGTFAAIAALAPASSADVYGAINGTTADKQFFGLREFAIGGVQNPLANMREWLMGIDMSASACNRSHGCQVRATFRGGTSASGCAFTYFLDDLGAVVASFGPTCNFNTLSTRPIGFFITPSDTLLVKIQLTPGAVPGAVTSVEAFGAAVGADDLVGTIHGRTSTFDWSNWGESGVGGVRNQSTSLREWLISVPSPVFNDPGVRFAGGAAAPSCAIAFAVNTSGALVGSSIEKCHSSQQSGWESLDTLPHNGAHVLYVLKLGGASSNGAADGGFVRTVRF